MATIFSKARMLNQIEEIPSLLCDKDGEEVERRSRCPFRKAQKDIAKFLAFHNMYVVDVSEVKELTPFFVRRDVYLCFFGHSY